MIMSGVHFWICAFFSAICAANSAVEIVAGKALNAGSWAGLTVLIGLIAIRFAIKSLDSK
jgi:hypothetical protein